MAILAVGKPLFTPFARGKLLPLLVICGDELHLPHNNLSFLVTHITVTQHIVICLFFGLQFWLTLVLSLKTEANTSFVLFSFLHIYMFCFFFYGNVTCAGLRLPKSVSRYPVYLERSHLSACS